ncbi:unnamed protein product [Tetraodon nigroviridis]|uniref:(spotted green pufferfish) hypothetical protein n=1 Tax=Tetraodon nigroviridis TaxID=99883 RepID=Q4RHE1_TETNG|nr:unnamed protein product [Tetraodon nigroviridis]
MSTITLSEKERFYQQKGRLPVLSSKTVSNFINTCLAYDPTERPSFRIVLRELSEFMKTTPDLSPSETLPYTGHRIFHKRFLKMQQVLGEGNFGKVILYRYDPANDDTGELVAVKTLKRENGNTEGWIKEINVLKSLDHRNIVKYKGCCSEGGGQGLLLIMEFLPLGSLLKYLPKNKLNLSQLMIFAQQICEGMEYLHSKRYIHRDLAARNVLLDRDRLVKIGDFGLTKHIPTGELYYRVSENGENPVFWFAVECLKENKFSFASDVWSFGVTLYEILTHCDPKQSPRKKFEEMLEPKSLINQVPLIELLEKKMRLPCPKNCPQEEVHELLGNYDLKYCFVDKYKGTAFVTLLNGDQAQCAIRDLHQHVLREKEISVQLQPTDALLCIANLPRAFTQQQFEELVRPFGNLERCFLVYSPTTGHSKGYGFVEYMKKDSAARAKSELLGKQLGSRMLYVHWTEVGSLTYPLLHSKCLCVDCLPPSLLTAQDLRGALADTHTPVFCQLAQGQDGSFRRFAVLEFATAEMAEEARRLADGRLLGGTNIRVSFCAPGVPGRSMLAALIAAQTMAFLVQPLPSHCWPTLPFLLPCSRSCFRTRPKSNRSWTADRSSKPPKANPSWQGRGKGAGVPHSRVHLSPDFLSHCLLANEGWCDGGRWPHTTRGVLARRAFQRRSTCRPHPYRKRPTLVNVSNQHIHHSIQQSYSLGYQDSYSPEYPSLHQEPLAHVYEQQENIDTGALAGFSQQLPRQPDYSKQVSHYSFPPSPPMSYFSSGTEASRAGSFPNTQLNRAVGMPPVSNTTSYPSVLGNAAKTPIGSHKRVFSRLIPSPEPSPEGSYVGQHSQGLGGHYADSYLKRKRIF